MTKTKTIRWADAIRIKAELEALPEREPETVSLRDALTLLASEIHGLRAKNYSWETIAELLAKHGIRVSVSVLRKRLGERRDASPTKGGLRGSSKDVSAKRRPVTVPASHGGVSTAAVATRADVRGDTSVVDGATQAGTATAPAEAAARPVGSAGTSPASPPRPATKAPRDAPSATSSAPAGDVAKTSGE